LGVNVFVNPPPPITGAPALTRLLTRDLEDYLGARFIINPDPVKAAQQLEEELLKKVS